MNLNFPSGATTARLLFFGLGSELTGSGWHQYFPAGAYKDRIAPTDEVLLAGLMTGVISMGLTAFALVSDINIATTWATIRKTIQGFSRDFTDLEIQLRELLALGTILTTAEALATGVASGGASYEDVSANHGNLSNLWSILVTLGTLIPKAIFSSSAIKGPLWSSIDDAFFEELTAEAIADGIPLVGEIFAVINAIGDAATLAEAIGETVASPWVFANQVTRSYPVRVTVSHDIRAATWPHTARMWQIQAMVDGQIVASPTTGPFNANGTESVPIVLNLSAPFGGNTITWSIVLLDANGHQVGTGASAKLANNNEGNLPSNVAFAIVEQPAVISATTVFRRVTTTTYSAVAGGYTWSNATNDSGTHLNAGIQEVVGVTVATRSGVAGIVFKQKNLYWLRGVPLVENGSTIPLGSATRQGYNRRPYLLFDALVGTADVGNHVLLEPDDNTDGYHVRRLAINPATAALSWDPTVSLGFFSLSVSAAALHSSGHVVAVHTDSGRLGRLLPANTPRPPLAAYTAGPGTQIGLLSSPTAVAVNASGILIVLEAGASQLAAFDLNGNPVRQFGSTTPKNFVLPLLQPRVYLDVAVDGSGAIYVLSYQSNGSQPDEYRIDVYSPTGAPVSVLSTGDNIPHVAVDYWRSIYAANYTPLLDTNGQVRIAPDLGVAEPSLSRFDPS